MLVSLTNLITSCGISGQIFGLISSFLSYRQLHVVLDGKSSREYLVNVRVPQGSSLGPTFFLLYINELPDDFICNIAIYADDNNLYYECAKESVLWQELELSSELKSDLQDTGVRSGLLISMPGKFSCIFFTGLTRMVLLM